MKTITFYVAAALCLIATRLSAQETQKTFEAQVSEISDNISKITKTQKDSLKIEVDAVNARLERNEISKKAADTEKQQLADKRAAKIEQLVGAEQEKLNQVVRDKVDGKLGKRKSQFVFSYKKGENDSTSVKETSYKRTTSQFVFALGVNRLVTDGETVDNDNFKWRSDFYEWGLSFNTRLFKNNNLLHAKYGLSLQYNNLRPNNNKVFVTNDNGQTYLQDSGRDLKLSRFRYVNLVVPVHLEFDFTKKKVNGDKTYFPTHESFRVGLGGYAGLNVKEKQITKYNEDGHDVKMRENGNFNVNDFIYGVSAYVGYGQVSLYAKYDLQPVFENNITDQNNLSLGIRFDFN